MVTQTQILGPSEPEVDSSCSLRNTCYAESMPSASLSATAAWMKGTLAIGTERAINPELCRQIVNLRIGAFGMKRVFCLLVERGDIMSVAP